MLMGPELSGAGHSGLDFVDHEQDSAIRAQLFQSVGIVFGKRDDAAFALDGLDKHGGGAWAHDPLHRREIAERSQGETLRQRAEMGLYLVLTRGGQGAQGPSVKGAGQGDDFVSVLSPDLAHEPPGQLDGPLVGLGPGVAEKDALEMRGGQEPPGQFHLLFLIEQIGGMHELSGLGGHDFRQFGMTVPQIADRDSRQKVRINPAFGRIQSGALGPADSQG